MNYVDCSKTMIHKTLDKCLPYKGDRKDKGNYQEIMTPFIIVKLYNTLL